MLLLVEAFYAGSHRQLITTLMDGLRLDETNCRLVTMSGRKWHWRARTSALHLAQHIPRETYSVLFTSSVTPLAELCGLRPDLAAVRKVLYFHENQLVYPVRKAADTDFQYGYNQITACLVADEVVFNSLYNMESFLNNIDHFMKTQPDYRPRGLAEQIRVKCRVLYFPLCVPETVLAPREEGSETGQDREGDGDRDRSQDRESGGDQDQESTEDRDGDQESAEDQNHSSESERPLHILWPHRWEHDKNPSLFFDTLSRLHEEGVPFRLSVLGERCREVPDVFERARTQLEDRIEHWGYLPSREDYWRVLGAADVVVSTADHEFFGVAVLEAVWCGCLPLCVDRLVYPEWFERRLLFRTPAQLLKRLRQLCRRPGTARTERRQLRPDLERFGWPALRERYRELLGLPPERDGEENREGYGHRECGGGSDSGGNMGGDRDSEKDVDREPGEGAGGNRDGCECDGNQELGR
ncbi:glycosyltransferase-like domain-containing protein 1 isoform X2 [Amphibalanus amphitrite]|uniref:glycosyltransferase-like domain-containing protein 1 isoform X2 n=1 Tax=Amphibalanus amphitrite TaxID=1232801 RepID=UPI001C91F5DA|nr:glycosyltransferase-like domain-containing protein 1 isoform X2 [Amphibalanus amphitrite]XP_043203278.1 glycosyltransferase-like domain-containing protein 1 isoform X2 [Amphibalanus amphitrite]XP_043203279.1 glycosyltransferase-like domain-containing protein 1 isoform X2 [Amphibalanus amphitrite]